MLKYKRILFMCKETYSYPLYYIAEKWKKYNTVGAFFFGAHETKYNKCLFNDTTYYNFKSDPDIKLFTSDRIADIFTRHINDTPIDYEYLKKIEEKYTYYRSLNCQIMSTQFFSRHYHYRTHMHPVTYEQQMYWLELNYKNISRILNEFKPDFVVDCDTAELGRMIMIEVCHKKNIPYLTIEYPRYEMYKEITFTLGLKNDRFFVEKYNDNIALTDRELQAEIDYIAEFNKKSEIMSKEFEIDITSRHEPDKLAYILRKIYGCFYYFVIDQDIKAGNYKLKKSNPVLYNDSMEYLKFFIRYLKNRNKLLKKNNIFEEPVKGENYVYMPLHMIPEATTFIKAPFYINELALIEEVSKSLPIGWYLYVKEHQSMVGERSFEFYRRVKKIPNVRLVQLNYYKDPKPWILNSRGVVTITGTSAYEAALLGKPSIVFGEILFNLIDGITKVENLEELPSLIQEFKTQKVSLHSCAAYIRTVKELGEPVNMIMLGEEGLNIIKSGKEPPEYYMNEVWNMERLFLRYMETDKGN